MTSEPEQGPDDDCIERSLRALGAEVDAALDDRELRCGPFLLMEEIGEGGYGVVYVAIQDEPVERRVAVKLLKHGLGTRDVLRRFRTEQQALARIDHPCVASILEAGVTPDGRPWFAMPLIEGDSITAACDDARLGVPERLTLLARVCDGVHAAHVQGILHRDLKPGNVLVAGAADGSLAPKIIDFGIAKALDAEHAHDATLTQPGRTVGTPAYMAPEQLDHASPTSDVRSDVYALGVLIAEVLSGCRPDHDADPHRRAPLRPSRMVESLGLEDARVAAEHRGLHSGESLRRALAGDVDAIAAKATMPEPGLRYQSAEALADDLRRAMQSEPVRARPPGSGYVVGRFLRRHRVAAAAAMALALGVVAVAGLSVVNARQARALSRASQSRAEQAEQLNDLLRSMFARIDPATARTRDSAMLLGMLDAAGAGLVAQSDDLDPEVLGEMTRTLVEGYDQLDRPEQAVALCRRLLPRLEAAVGAADRDDESIKAAARGAAKVATALGDAIYREGALKAGALPDLADREAPRDAWRHALTILERADELDCADGVRASIRLWSVRAGRVKGSDQQQVLAIEPWIGDRLDLLGERDPDRWRFVVRRAEIDDYTGLLANYPPLIDEYAAALGPTHPDVVKSRIRNVRFHVGAALESQRHDTKRKGIPLLRGGELQSHWMHTAGLSNGVVTDATRVFGPDHSITTSARLWDLAAQGHAFGPEHARPLYEALRRDVTADSARRSEFERQVEATWAGISVNPLNGIWWGP